MTEYKNSVVSSAKLEPLFSLGELYVSDFLKEGEKPKGPPCELKLGFDPISKSAQLIFQPDSLLMWGSMYWYRSNTNPDMRRALKKLAEDTINCIPLLDKKEVYVDCAGNDSTLLSFLDKDKFFRVNIDPSEYPEAKKNCDLFIQEYFSKEAYFNYGLGKCRYFSAAAVFYDLDKPQKFLQDVYEILQDDGVAVLQLSYTPLMLQQMEFGNLCHEHLTYHNLYSLCYICEQCGFVIKDLEINSVNGGSIRVYLQKDVAPDNFITLAYKYVRDIKVDSLLEWEENFGFYDPSKYLDFYERILNFRSRTVDFINDIKNDGKTIFGYGASTKAATLYQFFQLNDQLITAIAEKQECKWGLRTVGTNIPICSEEEMRKAHPNYLLIGPWFFREVFIKREKEYLDKGGSMIFPAPNPCVFNNKEEYIILSKKF